MSATLSGTCEVSTCAQCADQLASTPLIDLLIGKAALASIGTWSHWESGVNDLLWDLAEGPVHVLVFDAPGGRYLQLQLGHGRGRAEVSTSTTASNDGTNVELIAKVLIDSGFAAPDWSPHPALDSPNWSVELAQVKAPLLADFIATVLRDLMMVDTVDVGVSGFVVDRPCARCHWESE